MFPVLVSIVWDQGSEGGKNTICPATDYLFEALSILKTLSVELLYQRSMLRIWACIEEVR